MRKSLVIAVAASSALFGACATPVATSVQSSSLSQSVSDLGDSLARIYLKRTPMPSTVVVAPAVKHDGQLRPSYYGETLATLVSGALVNAGVPVVQPESTGWTSGQPVNVVVKRRAETANAGMVAYGSYHHIGDSTVVSYRLVDTKTGAVMAVSEARIDGEIY